MLASAEVAKISRAAVSMNASASRRRVPENMDSGLCDRQRDVFLNLIGFSLKGGKGLDDRTNGWIERFLDSGGLYAERRAENIITSATPD